MEIGFLVTATPVSSYIRMCVNRPSNQAVRRKFLAFFGWLTYFAVEILENFVVGGFLIHRAKVCLSQQGHQEKSSSVCLAYFGFL